MMLPGAVHSGSHFSNELVRELTDEEFRHEYMMDKVRSYIAFQIRALREQRRWNQGDLAKASGKTQSVISRLEDPDYGKLSLQSCLEIAIAYDLPLLVQFVEWDDWLARMSNMSPSALRKRGFDANRLFEIRQRMDRSAATAYDAQRGSATLRQLGLSASVETSAAANANTISQRPALSGRGLLGSGAAAGAAA
ncbi:helix-turn-helix domain-containing protein [Bradyrhizobium sp. Cp5.3]|uniref:helix-turn-helix domain-containing protein n=1 Tax=Bradyrhizobium sp. Cp5.3 TaxID=443598 RepID=UPI0009FD110D|nr:helix-turn-helix transcriptional regulator [Bradyrhizobium sp. Cp5.3]